MGIANHKGAAVHPGLRRPHVALGSSPGTAPDIRQSQMCVLLRREGAVTAWEQRPRGGEEEEGEEVAFGAQRQSQAKQK